jgi:hypothetical protein
MAKIGPPPKRSTKGIPPATQSQRLPNLERPAPGDSEPLNFKVPAEFKREFKGYAAACGISMRWLLEEGFRLVKAQHGS